MPMDVNVMPTPPTPTETKAHFISRALHTFLQEGDPVPQAIAKANSYWDRYQEKNSSPPKKRGPTKKK